MHIHELLDDLDLIAQQLEDAKERLKPIKEDVEQKANEEKAEALYQLLNTFDPQD